MKDPQFSHYQKLLLRKPLFSTEVLFDKEGNTINLDSLVEIYLNNKDFLEALYWASPQLYRSILAYKSSSEIKKKAKLLNAVKKYIIRASTRCTPFGVFAGCVAVDIDKENIAQTEFRKVRIDSNLLSRLVSKLGTEYDIATHLYYSLNNTVYKIANEYRFLEPINNNSRTQHQISSIERNRLINKVVKRLQKGTASYQELFSLVKNDMDAEQFWDFIAELSASHFITNEFQNSITANEPIKHIADVLNRVKSQEVEISEKYSNIIEEINQTIDSFQNNEIGNIPIEKIAALEQHLFREGICLLNEHLFQADLKSAVPAGFKVPSRLVKEVIEMLPVLAAIKKDISIQERELGRFKTAFIEKYEYEEIALLDVIDPEFGLGFPVVSQFGQVNENTLFDIPHFKEHDPPSELLKERLESRTSTTVGNIEISEDVVKSLSYVEDVANNISVLGTYTTSGQIYLQSAGGGHSNMLMSRFAYLDDQIEKLCNRAVENEKEQNTKIVFAEIVYLPQGKLGNVLKHQALYEFKIPILSSSTADNDKIIALQDIVITIKDGDIVLRSKKLNRRIIPRLSNAHNYLNSKIPVYQFLASLQHQNCAAFDVSLNEELSKTKFLSRIQYKNVILRRATWLIDIHAISDIKLSDASISFLKQYLVENNIPRFICVCEGDNELFIDTENESYLELLLHEILKSARSLKIVEWLGACNNGEEGNGFFQFVLPLQNKRAKPLLPYRKEPERSINRVFEPGTEWLYLKIYCSAQFSDKILSSILTKLCRLVKSQQLIDKFFFIRYTDPHYHLRVRILLKDKKDTGRMLSLLQEKLHEYIKDKIIWKIQTDTYFREIERYGVQNMETSETIFYADSLLYLSLVQYNGFVDDDICRFFAGIKNIHAWFELWGLSIQKRIAFCKKRNDAFLNEFGNNAKKEIEQKYRQYKENAIIFLSSNTYQPAFKKRQKILKNFNLPDSNLESYIHMSINRWFIARQRFMEYACYTFLEKIYLRHLYIYDRG